MAADEIVIHRKQGEGIAWFLIFFEKARRAPDLEAETVTGFVLGSVSPPTRSFSATILCTMGDEALPMGEANIAILGKALGQMALSKPQSPAHRVSNLIQTTVLGRCY